MLECFFCFFWLRQKAVTLTIHASQVILTKPTFCCGSGSTYDSSHANHKPTLVSEQSTGPHSSCRFRHHRSQHLKFLCVFFLYPGHVSVLFILRIHTYIDWIFCRSINRRFTSWNLRRCMYIHVRICSISFRWGGRSDAPLKKLIGDLSA